jgi:nitroreductase
MFLDIARNRQSVREYSDKPVSREEIVKCIEAASLAPSAHNAQPWRYTIVDDPSLKDRLCDEAFSGIFFMNKFARRAPVMIVVTAEPDAIANRLGKIVLGVQYFLLDIGASVEHLLLQASDLGLGACWLGWYSEKGVKKALDIPKDKKIISLICLGHPSKAAAAEKQRKPVNEITSFNAFKK